MHLHEFQAKSLFRELDLPVPEGIEADSIESAVRACQDLGGEQWVIKAQVHAGGRGKAGGVRIVSTTDEAAAVVAGLIGSHLCTHQTGEAGLPVNKVLVEKPTAISREFYLGMLVDRLHERVTIMVSAEGGMDIEQVAATAPEKILTEYVNPVSGFMPYQGRKLGFRLGLRGKQVNSFTRILGLLYRFFVESDASMVEINPLVLTAEDELLLLDAKVNIDENALFRRQHLAALRDETQEDDRERIARQFDLNYVTLDGNIACMVNGAGLAMATMDIIKLHGGEPANFLDVGGGTTAERVAEAFKLVVSDNKVRAILVNIFGGIVRCDLIAQGIIQAVAEVGVSIPVVVRLEGTNVDIGRQLLADSGLQIIAADDLADAARKAVEAAGS
jgi:succinyl-CoA synthetase beta subunit